MHRQGATEEWIKERYPDVWEELEKLGTVYEEESGKTLFKIDRRVVP